jgi:hypothetical protein
MALNPRVFHVDEDDGIHRVPWARFWRIYNRQEAVQLFAGKSIRFIEAITTADEHGLERILRASYQKVNFDKDGLWDTGQKRDELWEAMHQALGGSGKSDWSELYRLEDLKPFRWKPTRDVIERLSEIVRLKKKHG